MSLALYRTYRPGKFADLIGQEHVTGPLMRALSTDRVHHAYLFSGPRGCGKTSSARILARSLNCESGPSAEPCGVCQSCIDLAPNGPGSLDVVELDAASNRGIDQARELRERAMYAPASSRYRIYIIDEAHQLTSEAANALLKLVEEPPPHLRFVFATTEPEKLLGTIRSRTHHYPFRLVPTAVLQEHLAKVCEAEGVKADPNALALAARAGAGSVRDALSVLGQLVGGAGDDGITYDEAVRQLGFTADSLLDRVLQSLIDQDGAALFQVIEEVVSAGHDPRRFATDFLERLRDLIILQAAPSAAEHGLISQPADRISVLSEQAGALGGAALSRAADLVSDGITALKGATAPRLHLELLAARLLVSSGDAEISSVLARLDQLERKLASGVVSAPAASAVASEAPRPAATSRPAPPARLSQLREGTTPPPVVDAVVETVATPVVEAVVEPTAVKSEPEAVVEPVVEPVVESTTPPAASGEVDLHSIQAMWPTVVEQVKNVGGAVASGVMLSTWPTAATAQALSVGFTNPGALKLAENRKFDALISDALFAVTGRRLTVKMTHEADLQTTNRPTESLAPRPLADAMPTPAEEEAIPRADDEIVDDSEGAEKVAEMLGGSVIDSYDEKPKKKK